MADSESEVSTASEKQFYQLATRFRDSNKPEELNRLGDELGRVIFGGRCASEVS